MIKFLILIFISMPAFPQGVPLAAERESLNGNMYSMSLGIGSGSSTNEVEQLLLVNLTTSTINVIMDRVYLSSLTIGDQVKFRIRASPVVTSNGTFVAPRNSFIGSSNAAQAQVFKLPTTSNMGTTLGIYSSKDFMVIDDFKGRIVIGPGNSLLLTAQPTLITDNWSITLTWIEK